VKLLHGKSLINACEGQDSVAENKPRADRQKSGLLEVIGRKCTQNRGGIDTGSRFLGPTAYNTHSMVDGECFNVTEK
jgi:hypothetical protein